MIDEILALIDFPYMACIIFVAILLKQMEFTKKIKMVYVVLIEAALLGALFYFIKDVGLEVLIVTYFAATSCYELLIKQIREKMKI